MNDDRAQYDINFKEYVDSSVEHELITDIINRYIIPVSKIEYADKLKMPSLIPDRFILLFDEDGRLSGIIDLEAESGTDMKCIDKSAVYKTELIYRYGVGVLVINLFQNGLPSEIKTAVANGSPQITRITDWLFIYRHTSKTFSVNIKNFHNETYTDILIVDLQGISESEQKQIEGPYPLLTFLRAYKKEVLTEDIKIMLEKLSEIRYSATFTQERVTSLLGRFLSDRKILVVEKKEEVLNLLEDNEELIMLLELLMTRQDGYLAYMAKQAYNDGEAAGYEKGEASGLEKGAIIAKQDYIKTLITSFYNNSPSNIESLVSSCNDNSKLDMVMSAILNKKDINDLINILSGSNA